MAELRLPHHLRALMAAVETTRPAPQRRKEAAKRIRPPHWPPGVESELEMALLVRLERAGLPLGVGQYRIVPGRMFTWDRCWPEQRVCVEVNGGVWVKSGHSTGGGIERDCLKASMAAALGWRSLPVTKNMIEDGSAVELIGRALVAEIDGGEGQGG